MCPAELVSLFRPLPSPRCVVDNQHGWLSRTSAHDRVNLPNYITLTRIASIPLLIWILCSPRFSSEHGEKEILASAVFILASISDGFAVYLARKRDMIRPKLLQLDSK